MRRRLSLWFSPSLFWSGAPSTPVELNHITRLTVMIHLHARSLSGSAAQLVSPHAQSTQTLRYSSRMRRLYRPLTIPRASRQWPLQLPFHSVYEHRHRSAIRSTLFSRAIAGNSYKPVEVLLKTPLCKHHGQLRPHRLQPPHAVKPELEKHGRAEHRSVAGPCTTWYQSDGCCPNRTTELGFLPSLREPGETRMDG